MDSSNRQDPEATLVVVYRTRNVALWGMAKSILDPAPVEYWVRGERLFNTMFNGWSEFGNRPDLDVEFLVREADAEWGTRTTHRLDSGLRAVKGLRIKPAS